MHDTTNGNSKRDLAPVPKQDRLVANVNTGEFKELIDFPGYENSSALGVDPKHVPGMGFHVYKMDPGSKTQPHVHESDEHFYIIDGDLTDHDGYEYKAGDIIMMRKGTRHWSWTRNGCIMVVYIGDQETPVSS